jgi:benzoyl-CoA reductase/2-hydroxyglutaryl-CoA dehydratase subunit BcrC/BadD/HgdB
LVNNLKLENRLIPYKILLECLETTEELIERILPENEIPSLNSGLKHTSSVIKEYIEKAGEGWPIIGHHFAFQAEYLYCFDCIPVCLEGTSFFLSALLPDGVEKYYDLMSNRGHPYHTCTSQKGIMGMGFDGIIKFDALITPPAPCDNTVGSYQVYKHLKDTPLILPDIPYIRNPEGYEYYAHQLELSLQELGKVIGQEPDFNKLKKHIEIENKANTKALEIFELKKAIPCPVENLFNAWGAGASLFLSGRPEKILFYDDVLDAARKRYKNKEHHGGNEEIIRSIWPFMVVFFSLDLCEWLDRELGMSILFDIFNYNFTEPIDTSDEDKMFLGMAKRGMNYPMMKQSIDFYDTLIEDCVNLAKVYNANCFIFTAHIGCKQFGSFGQVLREALRTEVGIPLLIIDLDVGDKRMTSLNHIKEKINMFSQTLL